MPAPNLDWARLFFAAVVVWSHSFILQNANYGPDLLDQRFGIGASTIAVSMFFALSGFVILRSREESVNGWHFYWKRALRIFPAYLLVVLVLAIGFGLRAGWRQGLQIASLGEPNFYFSRIDGAPFIQNSLMGSVWSLRFEEICYLMVLLLFSLKLYQKWRIVAGMFAILFIGAFWLFRHPAFITTSHVVVLGGVGMETHYAVYYFVTLTVYFLAGSLIYLGRHYIPFGWKAFLATLLLSFALVKICGLWVLPCLLPVAAPYAFFCLGIGGWCRLPKMALGGGRIDLSYGVYLWHFPVIQWLMSDTKVPDVIKAPWPTFGVALMIALVLAWISWTFVESAALRLRNRFPEFRMSGTTWNAILAQPGRTRSWLSGLAHAKHKLGFVSSGIGAIRRRPRTEAGPDVEAFNLQLIWRRRAEK